jgi:ribosomal protein S18 acetylase RimI-like enzyme
VTLRPETADDLEFSSRLYASARAAEMALAPWTEEQKEAFLRWQFDLQHTHYHKFYPGASFLIIVEEGRDIGRMYVHRSDHDIRLMEITLLPEHRGRGIGGLLVRELIAEARSAGKKVSLHVERNNPARRLYERLGFRAPEDEAIELMEWTGD